MNVSFLTICQSNTELNYKDYLKNSTGQMKKNKIIAMIPARIGSTRLKMKNLALLNDKPLISYAINAAQESGVFDHIIINSDSIVFNQIAEQHGVEFYHRPKELGSSETKSDEVVADFLRNFPCDIIAWVNSIAPLQTGSVIKSIVEYFLYENLDTLHTVKNEQVHCNFKNSPINYKLNEIFSRTQDLEPLQPFVYTVMMWRAETFLGNYLKKGQAIFCGKVGYYAVDKISSIIVKDESDLFLVQNILQTRDAKLKGDVKVLYDKLAEGISNV